MPGWLAALARMLPDLEHLVTLQRIHDLAAATRTRLDELPARIAAMETRLDGRSEALARAERRYEDIKAERHRQEKALALVQTRLSRFKEQVMAVKTNREYQAMQQEIAAAEAEVGRLEDDVLEQMFATDELGVEVESARRMLDDERAAIEAERTDLEQQGRELERQLDELQSERKQELARLAPHVLTLFETVASHRNGIAVAPARDGRCSACQVRLRPQLFNQVRLNEHVIQCESCQRILYFEPQPDATPPGAVM